MKGLAGFSPASLNQAIECRESTVASLSAEVAKNNAQIEEFSKSINFLQTLNRDHEASLKAVGLHLDYMKQFMSCGVSQEATHYFDDLVSEEFS